MEHTKTTIYAFLFLLIGIKITSGQSNLAFRINDSIITFKKKPDVLKINLQIVKSDTIQAYNLYGFYTFLEPEDMYPVKDSGIVSCRLGCNLRDSSGKDVRPSMVLNGKTKLVNEKNLKLIWVDENYLIEHHLEKKENYPWYVFIYCVKIKKEDTLISTNVYIDLSTTYLKPGTYYLTLTFKKLREDFREELLKKLEKRDPDFYSKNTPIENEYDKVIISNKVKITFKPPKRKLKKYSKDVKPVIIIN